MTRAYSTIVLKAIDEEARIITGVASAPTPDREGDIVDPKGATFKLPMPFLWQHRADQPIGKVLAATITAAGIEIRAQIAKGVLPYIDDAWSLIRSGLVGGLSIGFRPDFSKTEVLTSGGWHFRSWEWLETSAVTIPANMSATIATIKSLDTEVRAASGVDLSAVASPSAGVSAQVVLRTRKGVHAMPKTYSEQIESYNAERAAKAASLNDIMQKAADQGVTLGPEENDAYKTLESEIEALDAHLARLEKAQRFQTVRPVVAATPAEASASRTDAPVITVRSNTPPGVELIRALICKEVAYRSGGTFSPLDVAKERYKDSARVHDYIRKAVVPAGTTTDPVWVGPLVYPTLASEFLDFLRPATILGKFGTNGIPGLLPASFNSRIDGQTSGGTAYWVGQGAPKPLTSIAFNAQTFLYYKVATISVLTEEAIRFSNPSAELKTRDALVKACVERLDIDFIDPTVAAVTGINPASITNGLTAMTSAGTSADNARTDLQNIIKAFLQNNQDPAGLVLIMPTVLALALSVQVNSLGQPEFPGISMAGGKVLGIPVITSQYAANQSGAGNMVIAVNTNFVGLADDGQVTVDISREASVQMSDAPTNNSATGTGTSLVSLWQTNSVGIRAERAINWAVLRDGAVVYMDDVNWGSIGSPA